MKMAASIGKGLPPLLKYGANKAKVIHEKQGIVTVLGSDISEQCKAPSLRRTLSADMSSKKWMSQNGLKRVASSKELKDEEHKNPNNSIGGSWSSILCEKINNGKTKEEETNLLPPPYVHPLEKKSSNPLSDKSLEVCTENLGSETGSDVFPSYASSDADDTEEENHHRVKLPYNCPSKKSRKVSFPPPIASLNVQSHREDGRLVLEIVSLPSQNRLQAERHDGRLVLTFANNDDQNENETIEDEGETLEDEETLNVFESDEDVVIEEEEESKFSSGQVMDDVDKSRAILMKEIMVVDEVNQVENGNGSWRLFNKTFNKEVENKVILSMRGGNNLGSFIMIPFLKGCKEVRRSLVMLEPHCIASS